MFTDKRHSLRGIYACVLGISGIVTLVLCIVRTYLAGGVVRSAQTLSLGLAFLYGLIGMFFGIWTLVRKESFAFFSALAVLINAVLLLALSALIAWGFWG